VAKKATEIKSQFLKFLLVLMVVTVNYLRVEGLIKFAAKGLKPCQSHTQ